MEKAGLDPFEVLKKNFVKPGGGYYWRDGKFYNYRGVDFSKAMDKGAEMFGWKEKWKGWLKPDRGKRDEEHGASEWASTEMPTSARTPRRRTSNSATTARRRSFSAWRNTAPDRRATIAKMAAEVLQIPPERISMTPADSLVTPFEFGPVGSRGTYAIGSAVINAAEDARRKLLEMAAPKLDASPDELDTADGVIFVKRQSRKGHKMACHGE